MKAIERPEYRLYCAHAESTERDMQELQRLFSVSFESQNLRVVHEIDSAEVPTSLQRQSIRHILSQFAAAGHAVDIVLYDDSWYAPKKVVSLRSFADSLVMHLQKLAPHHVTLHLASEIRKTSSVDALYRGLDAIALPELIGSGKGVDKKNSSRSMEPLLRRGFSCLIWQRLKANAILQLNSSNPIEPSTVVVLTIPDLLGIRPNIATEVGQAEHHTLFRAVVNIPDEQFLDTCRYLLTIDEAEHARIAALLVVQPLEAKKQLAVVIAALQTGDFEDGLRARAAFEEAMNGKNTDQYIEAAWHPDATLFDVLAATNICSRSELRRLFAGGAIRDIANPTQPLAPDYRAIQRDDIIRVGKKHRIRICAS